MVGLKEIAGRIMGKSETGVSSNEAISSSEIYAPTYEEQEKGIVRRGMIVTFGLSTRSDSDRTDWRVWIVQDVEIYKDGLKGYKENRKKSPHAINNRNIPGCVLISIENWRLSEETRAFLKKETKHHYRYSV